ncbi:hypothetical protein KY336_03730 [Candidatus Woesearchaeota archaeon]|nr:hypothetical protein [Candidatus Woesearchaeota archaeon]
MKILFGICTWGLGHATRDLPIIRRLLEKGHSVTIATSGRSLEVLKKEVPECKFIDFPDYPAPYTKSSLFALKFTTYLPHLVRMVRKEKKRFGKLLNKEKYDLVIADCRYGFNSREVPCFFITHQPRFIVPKRVRPVERTLEYLNYTFLRKFTKIFIPDYEMNGLTGDLSHSLRFYNGKPLEYIGILSAMQEVDTEQDIDYFISISGPEPQRTIFEDIIMPQLNSLAGNIVITLGKPEENVKNIIKTKKATITIFSYLAPEQQQLMFNKAKMVVSRSGYTTLMDLAQLGKKALFVPTVGQTEQEYLSHYHNKQKTWYSVRQKKFKLARDLKIAEQYPGFSKCNTQESVDRFMKHVDALVK